jgi:hypothetical protein
MTMNEQNPEPVPQRTRKVRKMLTDRLSIHPAYNSFFDLPTAQEVDSLAGEMRSNPHLPCHVEAEPDGTVLYGWQFVQAARQAGRSEMEVTVRQDLEGLDEYAKELEMIDANLQHGKLSPVTTARCLARAHELNGFVPQERRRSYQDGELSDVVARRLEVSKRSADRYVAVAGMPRWLQGPFDRGEVNVALAEKVRKLSPEAKKAVRRAMEEGMAAKDAIVAHLPKARKPFTPPAKEWDRFVEWSGKALAALSPRARAVKEIGPRYEAALRGLRDEIDAVLGKFVEVSDAGDSEENLSAAGPCGPVNAVSNP